MLQAIRVIFAVVAVAVLASCGNRSAEPTAQGPYTGPPITQIIVKKADRKMYLVAGKDVVRTYKINLGNQPVGHKAFEGDGRTPEGAYYINRLNPQSRYHLSAGISYPSAQDIKTAAEKGLRPGGDIFIHGLGPEGRALNRADWTAGCIAVTDQEIEEIYALLKPGVPIFIYP